jgi:hypothetical protein
MGFKQWLAKHTSKPSDFARAYSSGLVELIEYLAASVAAFSGKKIHFKGDKINKTAFESHFEMEMAGFEPLEKRVGYLIAPSIEELKKIADYGLLYGAFKAATAFLCLYSENAAHRYMKPENAVLFSTALYHFVAERITDQLGFSSDPRQVANTINELLPSFRCDRTLNQQSFGDGDGLELLLNHLSLSNDGSIQYGFVVGSKKQTMGCAPAMLKAILEIDSSLKRVAQELHW